MPLDRTSTRGIHESVRGQRKRIDRRGRAGSIGLDRPARVQRISLSAADDPGDDGQIRFRLAVIGKQSVDFLFDIGQLRVAETLKYR